MTEQMWMTMRPANEVITDVQRACAALKERGNDLLSWEWDVRFDAALSVTRQPQHEQVLSFVATLFPVVWDNVSIRSAPPRIAELSAAWGGLRPGQQMWTLNPEDDPLLFAVWWPWGCGTIFSLRVGCEARGSEAAEIDPASTLRNLLLEEVKRENVGE